MDIVDQNIISFMRDLLPCFDGKLGEVQREALEKGLPIIEPETARFLASICCALRPKAVLEIGCCTGFSAGVMHRYLGPCGHITTIDRYAVLIKQAKENFKRLGIEEDITFLEGNAEDILPKLEGKYDFIFLDAAKGQYLTYLPDCIRLLKIGGVFIADDIFQQGRVVADKLDIPKRQRTIHNRMNRFLQVATHTPGLTASLIPIGDGMLMLTKAQEVLLNAEDN